MKSFLIKSLITTAALVGSSAVIANTSLKLSSEIFVERESTTETGAKSIKLEEPKKVLPGDRLVFVVKYKNVSTKSATEFVVTNPMPRAVRFDETSDGNELTSIDGGKSWGILAQQKVATTDGELRSATKADVTHIKWKLNQKLAPGEGGKLVYRGVVK